MASRAVMKNKVNEEDGEKILAAYATGLGAATIARVQGFKIYCVEKYLRESGLMRDRKEASSIAMKRVAGIYSGKTNKERVL